MPVKTTLIFDKTKDIVAGLKAFSETRVYVGIPADKAGRSETEGKPINNATLMYIHEHGAPEINLPARPVLNPGVKSIQSHIPIMLGKAGKLAMEGNIVGMMAQFNALGLLAQNACRTIIRTSEGLAPLKPSTIADRRARGRTGTKPLWDTGQLLRAISYVVRKLKLLQR